MCCVNHQSRQSLRLRLLASKPSAQELNMPRVSMAVGWNVWCRQLCTWISFEKQPVLCWSRWQCWSRSLSTNSTPVCVLSDIKSAVILCICLVTDISATVALIGVTFCMVEHIGPGHKVSPFGGGTLLEPQNPKFWPSKKQICQKW